jgi:hypothetical protein
MEIRLGLHSGLKSGRDLLNYSGSAGTFSSLGT